MKPFYKLSYDKQVYIRDFFAVLISFFFIKLIINYKNYKIELLKSDKSAKVIYLSYLIHGFWKHEVYEQQIVEKFILKNNEKKCLFIDVGASYGMFSFLASMQPNVKRIVAIEPYLPVFNCLKNNVKKNNIRNIELLNMVVSDVDNNIYDIEEYKNSEWNRFKESKSKESLLKSISLDKVIKDYRTGEDFIFIKMDIEGNEPNAINGLQESISLGYDLNIMMEFHVGVLEEVNGRALLFAETIFMIKNVYIYIMDVGNDKLINVENVSVFKEIIFQLRNKKFPHNLFNLFIVNKKYVELINNGSV